MHVKKNLHKIAMSANRSGGGGSMPYTSFFTCALKEYIIANSSLPSCKVCQVGRPYLSLLCKLYSTYLSLL